MSAVQHFCARESLALGDPLAGTAAHAERNLLISWPRAKWQRSLRQASDMAAPVKARLEAIAESGRRVNLIHRRGEDASLHRVFLMPERREYRVPREELDDFLAALSRGEAPSRWHRGTVEPSLILCCTHGKKDKCCAKFGFATYKAIAEAIRDQALPFEVWESTHLGGCRLAASAVVFPALRKYGRITDADVVPLLESEAANRPYLPCYRGDSRLTPLAQCAQVAALEWLAARHLQAEVEVAEPSDPEAASCRLIAEWQTTDAHGRLAITCVQRTLERFDTCADLDADTPKPGRVWDVIGIAQLEPATSPY
ncbi:sucrase ferredoxin [Halomonas sp. LBP4]|uniref:sucrase ferredoxin n=1 Tax=Halomonas sp. LBP4 TaxID=2044917 RepID=UPI000D75AB61|nr:sucrase ferredoxin [Halomonas sp. LBP4]PXX99488.1 sucrase ferredoxin [Halomonas sp. LBP4]